MGKSGYHTHRSTYRLIREKEWVNQDTTPTALLKVNQKTKMDREDIQCFDEYEIYFTSETGFLIFSRVRSKSENIIKILSHE